MNKTVMQNTVIYTLCIYNECNITKAMYFNKLSKLTLDGTWLCHKYFIVCSKSDLVIKLI